MGGENPHLSPTLSLSLPLYFMLTLSLSLYFSLTFPLSRTHPPSPLHITPISLFVSHFVITLFHLTLYLSLSLPPHLSIPLTPSSPSSLHKSLCLSPSTISFPISLPLSLQLPPYLFLHFFFPSLSLKFSFHKRIPIFLSLCHSIPSPHSISLANSL